MDLTNSIMFPETRKLIQTPSTIDQVFTCTKNMLLSTDFKDARAAPELELQEYPILAAYDDITVPPKKVLCSVF